MYAKWVVALLLCWCGAGVVESTLTACPQLTRPSEYNITEALGTWYEIYHFKTELDNANATCGYDVASLTPEGLVRDDVYDFNVSSGVYEHRFQVLNMTDISALTLSLALEGNVYEITSWTAETDYTRYAVRWMCLEVAENTIIVNSKIFSRQKTLDEDALPEIDAILARIGVNRSQYELEVQTNCPDPTQDNTISL
ncbi:lopap-like [Periplaneta americana]|uniref:lopap-like n=1 Tax=Periplaneta americana TaxID=6978 RepID=UPI0037E95ED4